MKPDDTKIRILEVESNKIGDLFCRLMGDLFYALGYKDAEFNIHKTGREIDIKAKHRKENRILIAECKARKDKIGGDEINKFVGGELDLVKRKGKNAVGYFVSLSGFKSTAIEQEEEVDKERVILLRGSQVIDELIKGRIIVSKEKATERAGRCAAKQSKNLKLDISCELLAHGNGWIWAIYFTKHKVRTHFTLIHPDGESVVPLIAQKIIESDSLVGGDLSNLEYLVPAEGIEFSEGNVMQAKKQYFKYLSMQCGEITLEGLPADTDVGSKRFKFENIFVPLYIEEVKKLQTNLLPFDVEEKKEIYRKRESVGKVLKKNSRLAILAEPGKGKTTLLKRVAMAYSNPSRRKLVKDDLPDREWFPIFIRCRQLGKNAKLPIMDILRLTPKFAEMGENEKYFNKYTNRVLHFGNAILLIDGLDEISDESTRLSFAQQLCTFLAIYPAVSVIVTSRETGFRIIGGVLSSQCKHYRISDFNQDDINRLTIAWHKEVLGDSVSINRDAWRLARTICNSDRVLQLARNPLLLTILLLVKRWVGQFPSKRSVLYAKAIEVLLMTWNIEGYEPIDPEEAIPRLAFIAYYMMKNRMQRISIRRLKEILMLARKQMPEILGYAKVDEKEFIQRVEQRSSLMILSGYGIEEGTPFPMYEFRHLTFQEYLTARAITDGYYPDHKDEDKILDIIKPYILDYSWKEIIPLVAVLSGRRVQPIIEYLIELCKNYGEDTKKMQNHVTPYSILEQCILDEVQIAPKLLNPALEWIARNIKAEEMGILKGKYGKKYEEIVTDVFMNTESDLLKLGETLSLITLENLQWISFENLNTEFVGQIKKLLNSDNNIDKAAGCLAIMEIAYSFGTGYGLTLKSRKKKTTEQIENYLRLFANMIIPVLFDKENYLHFSASWAFAWIGRTNIWIPDRKPEIISRLLEIWRVSKSQEIQFVASWAISSLPIIDDDIKSIFDKDSQLIKFLKTQSSIKSDSHVDSKKRHAAIVIGYYLGEPWSKKELVGLIEKEFLWGQMPKENLNTMFRGLGNLGKEKLSGLLEKREILRNKSRRKRK